MSTNKIWTLTTMGGGHGLITSVHDSREAAEQSLRDNFGDDYFDSPELVWSIDSHVGKAQ